MKSVSKFSNQTVPPTSNVQSSSSANSTTSAQKPGTGATQSPGGTTTGRTSAQKSQRSTALSGNALKKSVKTLFLRALQSKQEQPLSRERRTTVEGMVSVVMASHYGSVRKAIEGDVSVRRPDLVVKALVKARMLPRSCYVKVCDFTELAKRQQAIVDHLDDATVADPRGYGISPLEGNQTFALLTEAVGHAHLVMPELIETDQVLQQFCHIFGRREVQEALRKGLAHAFNDLIQLIQTNNEN